MCSEAQWRKIKTEYVTTEIGYRPLAEKHGVSFSTLQARAKRESWTALKQEHQDSVETAVRQKEAEIVEQKAEEIVVTRQWITQMLKENAERAMQAIPVLDREGNPTGEYRYDGAVANRALELLGKDSTIGMFIDKTEHSGGFTICFSGEDELTDE